MVRQRVCPQEFNSHMSAKIITNNMRQKRYSVLCQISLGFSRFFPFAFQYYSPTGKSRCTHFFSCKYLIRFSTIIVMGRVGGYR